MVGLWIIWDYWQHTNWSVLFGRDGWSRGLRKEAIREEEDYAGNKLGSIIEQPCSHLFHAKCNPRFGFL
ncbi:hypothetical protein LCGC14_3026200, partial [marine sediment metagenome]